MRVLIVDDDIVDRESVKRSLFKSSFDCTISEALNVDSALAACEQNTYDIILLDYQLPQRNGIELLLELRQAPKIRYETIVMMSNSEDEAVALQCIQAGAQDFLLKNEITATKLRRTIIQAQKRFELERELKDSFDRVKRLAERDALTNLANRHLFDETFKVAVSNNHRNQACLALILFDLDNFKLINDSFGHGAGDGLLIKVCKRISAVLRGSELFARLGGDEFIILLTNLNSPYDVARIAQRIQIAMQAPFEIDGKEFNVSISIGISIDNAQTNHSSEELLKYADIAMYRSKQSGRGQISFFEETMQHETQRRLALENGIPKALKDNEFFLVYQPVFSVDNSQLCGFEALIRWQSPAGLIPPDEFIPIAEQSFQIVEIGRWVAEQAIQQISAWNKLRSKNNLLSIAINLSPTQLNDLEFPAIVKRICNAHQLAPSLVEFELTETAILESNSSTLAVLDQLVELGCTLALDDFGTGYSSISHLNSIPLTTVKLDKSLMPLNEKRNKTDALVTGLVQMLKILELDIVAEGVETEQHKTLCQNLNVTRQQGYYFDPGLTAHAVTERYLK
ncbi:MULTISPECIES: putative bifunctional diguanylate cyclase/phosphodiesterase [Neptunomonas]|uniref:putative bifunctional diguanylate cyclase/phosphodiesterase n=1 Tax=Neptunomonas TaxID=75687 RepID=UPI0025B21DE1|nr:GGDEF domain-containing response regulator [Neptunomonas sp. CHC150]MDN2658433.1 EAL domain-containing protein [Neptunomonas sp. CHC150]